MKRRIILKAALCSLLLAMLFTNSCKKVETVPKDWFGSDLVFDTLDRLGTVAAFNLNDLYNYIPNGFNRIGGDFLDAASGDAIPSRNNTLVEYYTNRRVSVVSNPDPYWGNSYAGIRRTNIFMQNINKVPIVETDAATIAQAKLTRQYWRAEARFIRVLMYFELLKRYGGVPLIGDKIFTLDDNLQIPRNTFEQCVNYIVSECNIVKDSLRKEAIADGDWGRVPRGAAIALKCRVLLYAASPLFNGGGIETDPVKRALAGYPAYDANRWNAVIAAAEELRNLAYYKLNDAGTPNFFASTFITKKNAEIILAKQSSNNTGLENTQAPVGFAGVAASQGFTSPTQNLVDAFPMLNGLQPFNADGTINTASGYSASNPYTNRDPRLDVTVFRNGYAWLGRTVETYEGGRDKPNTSSTAVQTKTGYYLRKFLGNFPTGSTYSNQSHNFPIFRYAETLLNYAEALNEVGRVEDAVTQIGLIRKRAGITAGSNNRYGIRAGITQTEMREVVRNERRIELAFEEHRFWDIRRWKTAAVELAAPVFGMRITLSGSTLTYQKVQVGTLQFDPKLYHMPIPYDEMIKNLALIQNEGW
ncbi:RagB/SusD family nutrient uptake outer membrane protein [Lacibacter luteus]|uniref:RagB/SusD family nutrient uptake outer membrane protein n=1 Tax=Lacibacter luteus TaxID=2508719 RepID=A0A4Q1CNQ4_9BACT|nr:RagB/SusD family nutrient uptake outer membrane protein [Lacibacter luteus]RXK62249.1 RagB/SusD family nutrient uptake outer membrane protein [Lacibacter luteus]